MEVGEEDVVLPDGRTVEGFLWVRTRDFAIVVPVTERDEIVMVRSYKHGTRNVSLSLPAGYIEEGEDPLATAKRELKEETGYKAEAWSSLGRYVVDGNYGVATEHVFLARGAREVTAPDSGDLEEIQVLRVPRVEIPTLLSRGEVAQLSSAAALGLALVELGETVSRSGLKDWRPTGEGRRTRRDRRLVRYGPSRSVSGSIGTPSFITA